MVRGDLQRGCRRLWKVASLNMREYVTVVSGVPRSGTSLMMRMLEAGGLPALTDGIRKPDIQNPARLF